MFTSEPTVEPARVIVRKPRPMPGAPEVRRFAERRPRPMPGAPLRLVEPPSNAPAPGAHRAIVRALAEWVVADLVRHPAPA